MKTIQTKPRPPSWVNPKKNAVKLTALLYLREALLAERYEQCREFIAVARQFGAQRREVEELLEDPRRKPR